jgi:DNA-binding NarL/FixJ family response regulator
MGTSPASFGRPVKILIADDHPVIRKMVTATLKQEPGFDVIAEAENGLQAVDKAGALKLDVVTCMRRTASCSIQRTY